MAAAFKIALLAASVGFAGSAYSEGTLNVYNWAEYIGEETIANFEEEFDVKVTYDNYDSVETVDAKLIAGNTGYDVVSHASSNIAKLIPTGVLMPLESLTFAQHAKFERIRNRPDSLKLGSR